jgi:alpha-glucosidase
MGLPPHHDGSTLYVLDPTPQLGQKVRVRVRIAKGNPYIGVRVRSTYDADIHVESARRIATNRYEDWYEAQVLVHNSVTRYRFMLLRGDGLAFDWLNAIGVRHYEVSDADDFQITAFDGSPAWNTAGVAYQIFPDRFAASSDSAQRQAPAWAVRTDWRKVPMARGRRSGGEWYGGDLKGIEEHLDYIQGLGFTTVYLTPFFPAGSVHRYDALSFEHVDPMLGGDDALRSLARACHARGMRLVGDLTLNHTGSGHEWFRTALADPDSPEREFYMWRHYPDDYVAWMDVPTLPKLDWKSEKLMDRMVRGPQSVAGKWLGGDDGLDGWRIDVGNQTGRYGAEDNNHKVAVAIRKTVDSLTDGNGVLIAEHMHDPSCDLAGDGWQGVMNYGGFSRPVWNWLCDPGNDVEYMGLGVNVCRRDGTQVAAAMQEFLAHIPWKVALSQWNNLGSHDTARIRTLIGDPALVRVAVGLLMTFPGVPMVFAGDEREAVGLTGEQSRVTIDWDEGDSAHAETMDYFKTLLRLRAAHPALQTGGLRWIYAGADSLAYAREDSASRLLVTVSRAPGQTIHLDDAFAGEGEPRLLFGAGSVRRGDGDGCGGCDGCGGDRGDDRGEDCGGWNIVMNEPSLCLWELGAMPIPQW